MSIDDRFIICADIGSAIMALHTYGLSFQKIFVMRPNKDTDVIHGDIKPGNMLVFKDETGKTTIKVTAFGYSTFATCEEGCVFLPKSRLWNGPEHHFGGFNIREAKKTDVYSFGIFVHSTPWSSHIS